MPEANDPGRLFLRNPEWQLCDSVPKFKMTCVPNGR